MAATYPSTIRQRVAARVLGAATGLHEGAEPYEFFRSSIRSPVRLSFAVGVPSTVDGWPNGRSRQSVSEGVALVTSEVRVLVAYQLSEPKVASSDVFRDIEAAIRNRLLASDGTWPLDFPVLWVRSDLSAGPDGWLYSEQTFTVPHVLPIS